jgi:hypothetical protein
MARANLELKKSKAGMFRLYSQTQLASRYGRIKAMAEEFEDLEKAKAKIAQAVNSRRSKADMKESLSDIININKEILLSKLTIKMRKDEIKSLDAEAESSQANLALQKQYFEHDCKFVKKLLSDSNLAL